MKLRERDRVWETRFVWFLLLALVILASYHYVHSRVDGALRNKIVELLAKQFPQHLVNLDSAHLEEGKGIVLEGLKISLPTSAGPRTVIRIPRLIAQGNLHLVGLIGGDIPVQQVYMDSVDVSLWPTGDGQWSIQTLGSDKPIPPTLPPIDIRRGILRIGHELHRSDAETIYHDLNVTVRTGEELVSPFKNNTPFVKLSGSLSGSNFANLDVQVDLTKDKKQWFVSGKVKQLFYSPQWADKLPRQWNGYLVQLAGFSGRCDAEFTVNKPVDQTPAFSIHGHIFDGRLQHPKLPYPLENLEGTLYCRNNMLQLRKATASSGGAKFLLEADVNGLSIGAPMLAKLEAKSLPLDDRLYGALPRALQEQWKKLNITGIVDSEITLKYDGKKWNPDIIVHARQGSLDPDIFPYPISDVQGSFHYCDGILVAKDITAIAKGQILRGSLHLQRAWPRWLIDLSISSDGPVPLDESLISALAPRGELNTPAQKFVRSLSPTGTIHLESSRFVRTADSPDVLSKNIEFTVYGGSIRYAEFRYPIFDLQGHVSIDDSTIKIQRVKGRNDSAQIHCEGSAECIEGDVGQMRLDFDVFNIPLEEELHAALPSAVRQLWSHLRPGGVIDRAKVQLTRHGKGQPTELSVNIQEDGKVDSVAGRSVSIRPLSLPYLLSDIACDIDYRPGYVHIRRFSASHDISRVKAEGECTVKSDGSWSGLLCWLPTTRLMVDQSLIVALPPYLQSPLNAVEFRGPLSITGQTLVATSEQSGAPEVKAWDLACEIEDGRLGGGSIASGIRGSVHVQGENSEEGPRAKGVMAIDSATVKGVPIINLTGPFAISDQKLLLGRLATPIVVPPIATQLSTLRQQSEVVQAAALMPRLSSRISNAIAANTRGVPMAPSNSKPSLMPASPGSSAGYWEPPSEPKLDIAEEDLRAKALSGTLTVYGIHPLVEGRTELNLTLADANLLQCLSDLGEAHPAAEGRLWIECKLAGSLLHSNTLGGSGQAWLRDANFYQVPVMARLLRVLSVRQPDAGAFESADVQFRFDGDRIPIDKISLDGDIISLRGSGFTSLRRELQLDLFAYVGNRSALAAVFGPLVSQNDSATMLHLEVSGTTDNPQFRRSLPLMGTTLQQVFPDRVFGGQSAESTTGP